MLCVSVRNSQPLTLSPLSCQLASHLLTSCDLCSRSLFQHCENDVVFGGDGKALEQLKSIGEKTTDVNQYSAVSELISQAKPSQIISHQFT